MEPACPAKVQAGSYAFLHFFFRKQLPQYEKPIQDNPADKKAMTPAGLFLIRQEMFIY